MRRPEKSERDFAVVPKLLRGALLSSNLRTLASRDRADRASLSSHFLSKNTLIADTRRESRNYGDRNIRQAAREDINRD